MNQKIMNILMIGSFLFAFGANILIEKDNYKINKFPH